MKKEKIKLQAFNPDIRLETERLILRFMQVNDTHAIFSNINHDKDVLTYFLDKYCQEESEMTLFKTIDFCLKNKRYIFAIELKDSHEVIGMILQCSVPDNRFHSSEIGFAIGKKYWNKGYTTEAFKRMIDFCFESGVHKVVASHIIENLASKRVIEKCGLIYEGRRKDDIFYHDKYHDVDYYYILKNE